MPKHLSGQQAPLISWEIPASLPGRAKVPGFLPQGQPLSSLGRMSGMCCQGRQGWWGNSGSREQTPDPQGLCPAGLELTRQDPSTQGGGRGRTVGPQQASKSHWASVSSSVKPCPVSPHFRRNFTSIHPLHLSHFTFMGKLGTKLIRKTAILPQALCFVFY